MILALALSSALSAAAATLPPVDQVSPPVPAPVQASHDDAVDLGDVTVSGRRLEEAARNFVQEIGAPARGRGLARWRDKICIGVANLQRESGQFIVDRVSSVALDLDLTPGDPGCKPNTLVIVVKDPNTFTEALVSARPRLFLVGGSGMDLGPKALERFKVNSQPVRWWAVSVPVDSHTHDIAIRLPDEEPPTITSLAASRLSSQIVDDTARVFVIVDADKIAGISLAQLGDYLAMVILAQVDPEADTTGYNSVLNLFNEPEQTPGLSDWDRAYLEGLYAAERTRTHQGGNRNEIASAMIRVQQRLSAAQDALATPETPTPTP